MPKTQAQQKAIEAAKEVMEEAVKVAEEEQIGHRPGMVVGGRKIPWTRADVEKRFPKVTLTPAHSMPVTFNGVRYDLLADVEMTVPEPIARIYRESQIRTRAAGSRRITSYGPVTVNPGAGLLSKDET